MRSIGRGWRGNKRIYSVKANWDRGFQIFTIYFWSLLFIHTHKCTHFHIYVQRIRSHPVGIRQNVNKYIIWDKSIKYLDIIFLFSEYWENDFRKQKSWSILDKHTGYLHSILWFLSFHQSCIIFIYLPFLSAYHFHTTVLSLLGLSCIEENCFANITEIRENVKLM